MDFITEKNVNFTPAFVFGKVVANYDDNYKGMVRVAYFSYGSKSNVTDWMRIASPAAGKNKGIYFLPEVGDEVIVAFINNDINNPCVIGALWNESDTPPEGLVTKENTAKALTTRSGITIVLSDEKDKESIKINTPKNMEILISDENSTITLKDSEGKNKIEINSKNGNISIKSDKKLLIESEEIEISGTKKLTLKSNEISIDSKGKLQAKGSTIDMNATSSAKLASSGIVDVKGSLVKING